MISTYRLGDVVFLYNCLREDELNDLVRDHPNSIGCKFILEKRRNSDCDSIDIITKIVLEHMNQCSEFLPKDISDSTVIHLRLGDVVGGEEYHEKQKRPLKVEHIKSLLINDTNKKYVIGKCFFAEQSSTNYEECIHLSNIYLHNVIDELEAEYFNSGDADIDLCCAIKSKLFVQGKGFYSCLIVAIRNKLNFNNNIETTIVDDI